MIILKPPKIRHLVGFVRGKTMCGSVFRQDADNVVPDPNACNCIPCLKAVCMALNTKIKVLETIEQMEKERLANVQKQDPEERPQ